MAENAQRHRIRRQVLEIQAPDEESARRVQPELSRIQRQQLESIIEECCSELSAPDRIHRIDSLELDLGVVDVRQLERDLPGKLKSVMRATLAKEIEKQDSESRRRDNDPSVTSQLELLAFFVATGTLPWWADSSNPRLVPEALDALLDHAPDRLADLLRTLVRERGQLARIVVHCDDQTLSRLLRVLASASPLPVDALQRQTDAILSTWSHLPGANITRIRNAFWSALIRQAAGEASPASLWQQVFGDIETQSHEAYVSLATGMLRAARSSRENAPAHLALVLRAIVANPKSRVLMRLPTDVQSELVELVSEQAGMRTGLEDEVAPLAESIPRTSGETGFATSARRPFRPDQHLDLAFGDADTVYIENAGLVILWPFLTRFFERIELVERRQIQERSRPTPSRRTIAVFGHRRPVTAGIPDHSDKDPLRPRSRRRARIRFTRHRRRIRGVCYSPVLRDRASPYPP